MESDLHRYAVWLKSFSSPNCQGSVRLWCSLHNILPSLRLARTLLHHSRHLLNMLKIFDICRKLTAEEAARMASESELERKLREASTAVQDVELYRYLYDSDMIGALVAQSLERYSGFLLQGMLTGWVGITPLPDPSAVAVLRDQAWVIRWVPGALLESLRLDQVELRPSQLSLALRKDDLHTPTY